MPIAIIISPIVNIFHSITTTCVATTSTASYSLLTTTPYTYSPTPPISALSTYSRTFAVSYSTANTII